MTLWVDKTESDTLLWHNPNCYLHPLSVHEYFQGIGSAINYFILVWWSPIENRSHYQQYTHSGHSLAGGWEIWKDFFCEINVWSIFLSIHYNVVCNIASCHYNVIKSYWPFQRGIHWSTVNFPHKGQWRKVLMFSLICALNKGLSKQSWGWWFEMPSCSLWRHCNVGPHIVVSRPDCVNSLRPSVA